MSEPVTEPLPVEPQEAAEPKTFDADYVSKLRAEAAKYRTEAKANKEAADKLAAFEASQKSAEQKLTEQLTAAERRALDAENRIVRHEIAAAKGIPDWADLLTGDTPEEIEAKADLILKRISEASAPRAPKPDPTQGRSGNPPKTTADSFAAFFNAQI